MKRPALIRRFAGRAGLLLVMLFSASLAAHGQTNCTVTNTAAGGSCMAQLAGYHGEQWVSILYSSGVETIEGEVDTYAEATWMNDSDAESVDLAYLAGWISAGPGGPVLTAGTPGTGPGNGELVSITTTVTANTTYTMNAQLSLCFSPPHSYCGEGCAPGGPPCGVYDTDCQCIYYGNGCQSTQVSPNPSPNPQFSPGAALGFNATCAGIGNGSYVTTYPSISVSTTTAPPQILTSTPSSDVVGASGQPMYITGSNLLDSSGDAWVQFSNPDVTGSVNPGATPTNLTVTYSIAPTAATGPGTVQIWNRWGTSNTEIFSVLTLPPQNPNPNPNPGPPLDPCAVTSNPQSGYSSIVPYGTPGGSGTLMVSFSGAAFAAISPTINYGPYSTPSSIAASIAALITKSYLQYGLSAKAFGPNIVYSGDTTLGAVTNATTGASFTTSTSSTSATETETACESAPSPPQPPLSCSSVTRGGMTTCVATGGAVSNWSFTDGSNSKNIVTRTTNPTSRTWGGVMATSGTVSALVAGAQQKWKVTVSPRTGRAFTAASATQQMSPYTGTSPCPSLSVMSPPVAPPPGATATESNPLYALGLFGLCQPSPYSYEEVNSGPNSGYTFVDSATNGSQFNWVGAQDILDPSSVFYGKQCGNYDPAINIGFISGANLSFNLTRHESSATPGQGHYGNYVAAQNLTSLNLGIALEPVVAFGDNTELAKQVNATEVPNANAILTATQVEPPEPQYNGLNIYLGDINYPPYALTTATPTCP